MVTSPTIILEMTPCSWLVFAWIFSNQRCIYLILALPGSLNSVDVFISLDLLFLCFLFLWKNFTFNRSGVFILFPFSRSHGQSQRIRCDAISYFVIILWFHLIPHLVSACLLPRNPPLSLHSMRVKAPKLCLPLPPLLRLSTPRFPSPPAACWTTPRWRRSWRSASSCRWRCRGYGKKTNRSGWDVPKHSLIATQCFLQDGLYFFKAWTLVWNEDT